MEFYKLLLETGKCLGKSHAKYFHVEQQFRIQPAAAQVEELQSELRFFREVARIQERELLTLRHENHDSDNEACCSFFCKKRHTFFLFAR